MADTLSSSIKYMDFDSDRTAEVGYRLPADPYWLAPPQGSLVPLWHEGGAPNYQPKPMICRPVQDPIKVWYRETPASKRSSQKGLIKTLADAHESHPRIRIFSCSAGVNAGKMAHRLHEKLQRLVHEVDDPYDIEREKALNQLTLSEAGPEDIILIIASTTGRGEIPRNAQTFIQRYESADPLQSPPRFSCFANGDSIYGDSYDAAGKTIQQLMTKMSCRPPRGVQKEAPASSTKRQRQRGRYHRRGKPVNSGTPFLPPELQSSGPSEAPDKLEQPRKRSRPRGPTRCFTAICTRLGCILPTASDPLSPRRSANAVNNHAYLGVASTWGVRCSCWPASRHLRRTAPRQWDVAKVCGSRII